MRQSSLTRNTVLLQLRKRKDKALKAARKASGRRFYRRFTYLQLASVSTHFRNYIKKAEVLTSKINKQDFYVGLLEKI